MAMFLARKKVCAAPARTRRPIADIAFDRAAVGMATIAALLLVVRLAQSLGASGAPWIAAGLLAGLGTADFVSALAHWFGDTYFAPSTPLLGAFVGPFRLHHDDPEAFRRHDVFQRNRNNALAALPLLVLACFLAPRACAFGHPLCGTTSAVAAIALASATQIHAWAHDEDVPRLVGWLQRWSILLRRDGHARHHQGTHDRAYAIVNGWTNGVLDRIEFFRRAEWLAARFGLRPVSLESKEHGSRPR
jgi:plasmanylethanolamine desaturase